LWQVRLPVSADWILTNRVVGGRCGEYAGWRFLRVLDDVLARLRAAGLFATLSMHTLSYPEANEGLWCGATHIYLSFGNSRPTAH